MLKLDNNTFEKSKLKINKIPGQSIAYTALYDNEKWTLKMPVSIVRGNVIKMDKYYSINIEGNTTESLNPIKTIESIIEKQAKHDNIISSIKTDEDSNLIFKCRIDENTKFYDNNGRKVEINENNRVEDIINDEDTIKYIIKLRNIKITKELAKCNWYISQIKLLKKLKGNDDCEISDDSDIEKY